MPPEDSTIEIETVQHPTLGPLKFPSDMPYEQRNQLIEGLEAEQNTPARTGVEAENSQDLARFALGQSTPKMQPRQEDSSVLQPYFSQPATPANTGVPQDPSLRGALRLPRFYGAPPNDPNTGSVADVSEKPKSFETNHASVLDRIRPPQIKDSTIQPSMPEAGSADVYRSSPVHDLLARRIGLTQPGIFAGATNENPSSTGLPFPTGKNLASAAAGSKQLMGNELSRATNSAEALANVGMTAPAGMGMQKAITGRQSNTPAETPKPILKGKVGRTEAGADNQPEDVKVIQQLLNAAIDSGELTGKKLVEDGKVTPQMLAMIDDYQNRYIRGVQPDRPKRPGTPAKIRLIDDKSSTLKQLRQNPFADPRWNQYDDIIKREVAKFNQKFPNSGLDWQLVKAMLWQESGGPDRGIEWTTWPMQIGRRKADTAIKDLINGKSYTDIIADSKEEGAKKRGEIRKEIEDAYLQHRMTPELNIRAAIIYLLGRKIATVKNVTDSPMENEVAVERGDTVSKLAKKLGTTEEQLYQNHPELRNNPNALRPGKLHYSKAHLEAQTWSDVRTALHNYNSEKINKHYADQVLQKYEAIKRRWPQ